MGKTLKNLPEGQDFNHSHFKDAGFGFSGSAEPKGAMETPSVVIIGVHHGKPAAKSNGKAKKGAAGGALNQMPTDQVPLIEHHADGGHTAHHADGRRVRHFANGGHAVFHTDGRIDSHYPDGSHSTNYPDGRTSHHHADGRIEHRHPDGRIVKLGVDGSVDEHDSSEYAHGGRVKRGDSDHAEDAKMVKSGIRQHEDQEHDGNHSDLHLARGGSVRTRLPRSMVPRAAKIRGPIATRAPAATVNRAPRNPMRTPTPRNDMPGGQAPYGVEPSAEPDTAGSDQSDVPQLKKGGHVRKRG